MPSSPTTATEYEQIHVGDAIRFTPDARNGRKWTVRARDERYIVATAPAPFQPSGALIYTVVDLTGWTFTYNGVGPGIARSSLNTLGGGSLTGSLDDDGCEAILAGLASGEWELSRRRVCAVQSITVVERHG